MFLQIFLMITPFHVLLHWCVMLAYGDYRMWRGGGVSQWWSARLAMWGPGIKLRHCKGKGSAVRVTIIAHIMLEKGGFLLAHFFYFHRNASELLTLFSTLCAVNNHQETFASHKTTAASSFNQGKELSLWNTYNVFVTEHRSLTESS